MELSEGCEVKTLFFCLLLHLNEPNSANRFSEFAKFLNIQMSSIIHIWLQQAYVQDVRTVHMGTSQQMVSASTSAKCRNTDKVSIESLGDERREASCVTTKCINTSYSWCPDTEQSYIGKQEIQMFRLTCGSGPTLQTLSAQ